MTSGTSRSARSKTTSDAPWKLAIDDCAANVDGIQDGEGFGKRRYRTRHTAVRLFDSLRQVQT
jgi:hypothetical protein